MRADKGELEKIAKKFPSIAGCGQIMIFAVMMIQAPNQRDYYRPLFRNLVYAALLD